MSLFKKEDFGSQTKRSFTPSEGGKVTPFDFFSISGSKKKEEKPEVKEEIDVDALVSEAYQKGLAEGKQAAEAEIKQHVEQIKGYLKNSLEELRNNYNQHLEEVEKEAVKLSLLVSRKVIEATAEVNPEYIIDVVRKGLKEVGGEGRVTVYLSEQDFEFLDVVGFPPELTEGIDYEVDDSIASGCRIKSEFGSFDLELDAMFEALHRKIVGEIEE